SIRSGQTIGARTWVMGLHATRVAGWHQWRFDVDGQVWHQPEWGGEFKVTAYRRLGTASWLPGLLSLVVQGGYKTNGYMPGDRLGEGAILRVGASLTP